MTVQGSRGRNGAPPGSRPDGWGLGVAVLTMTGALAVGAFIFFRLLDSGSFQIDRALGSVILLVAGFVTVTLLMLAASVVMSALGMRAPSQALGMPSGTIRALIAMVLILIFAIIGVVVFTAGSPGDPLTSTGLTQTQIDSLRANGILIVQQNLETPAASPPTYTVVARAAMTPDSHDFGLQLLTTVSTLVVAVAGFYFGSKATDRAIQAAREFQPPPRPAPTVIAAVPEPEAGETDEDQEGDEDADGPRDEDEEPTDQEPSGEEQEPTGKKGTDEEPTEGEPTGEEPTGEEQTGEEPTGEEQEPSDEEQAPAGDKQPAGAEQEPATKEEAPTDATEPSGEKDED